MRPSTGPRFERFFTLVCNPLHEAGRAGRIDRSRRLRSAWSRRTVSALVAATALFATGPASLAETAAEPAPGREIETRTGADRAIGHAPPWSVRMHFRKAHESMIGRAIVSELRRLRPDYDQRWRGLVETIGLDPREDLERVRLMAGGFESQDLILVAELGETTGTLEGWLLTLPGYDSEPLDDETMLHTFLIEDQSAGDENADPPPDEAKRRVWLALPRAADGSYRIVASYDEKTTRRLSTRARKHADALLGSSLDESELLAAEVRELPAELRAMDSRRPGSAVLRSIEAASISLSADERARLSVGMEAPDAPRARQLAQLLQGLAAMFQFQGAQADGEARAWRRVMERVRIEHTPGEKTLAVNLTMSQRDLESWLRAMAQHRGPPRESGF